MGKDLDVCATKSPIITVNNENIRLRFDCGYRTMKSIEDAHAKKYKISTIATTVGSHHTFLVPEGN